MIAKTESLSLQLDSYAIRKLLPHRDVMALLDGITDFRPAERKISAFKRIATNEFTVRGYYPNQPMFPATLIVEALAQTCGIMMNMEGLTTEGVDLARLEDRAYLASIPEVPLSVLAESHIRQRSLVMPGDTLCLNASIAMQRAEFRYFKVEATAQNRVVASGTILLSYPTYM